MATSQDTTNSAICPEQLPRSPSESSSLSGGSLRTPSESSSSSGGSSRAPIESDSATGGDPSDAKDPESFYTLHPIGASSSAPSLYRDLASDLPKTPAHACFNHLAPGQVCNSAPHYLRETWNGCEVCSDKDAGLYYLTVCGHMYCMCCVVLLFRDIDLRNRILPHCCREIIPADANGNEINTAKLQAYCERAGIQYTLCCERSCNALLLSKHITDGTATCPMCLQRTCITCGGRGHCRELEETDNIDPDRGEPVFLARRLNPFSCPECREPLHIVDGCGYMQ
ncbi:hypothetical protein F4802DRAFT_497380 [Xylaria palmicola]|nr:hypothetical protein F4802DRAFT_497380 [Xylaria palmicola]